MSGFRWQFVWPLSVGTLFLVGLCAFTAVSLFHQQATITGVLRENVSSRRAAADLRATLNTLVALETHQIEAVSELHTRAAAQVGEVRQFANHPHERELAARLGQGFDAYLREWQSLPAKADPTHAARVTAAGDYLEEHVLRACRDIEAFNDEQVEETTRQHELVLTRLAWGMAVVGALGAVAGVVLGYGVARLLNRSIRRLRVQVRDAAGKLGPEPTEIVLTGDVGFGGLQNELEDLTARIEGVVQQLHDREREVARAEQLAAVGQLAAGVGHELRNPLTSIKMLVQTGLEPGGAPLTTEDLAIIEGEVRRMERSLQTFLDFARPPKPERRPVELRALLEGVLGLVRGRAEKQHVTARLDAEPLALTADAGQLQQVFINLVLNALDAMPGGGDLVVTARRSGAGAEFQVSDTGPGVPRDMMNRLFEPFASSKDTGLGLGLVISKRIVEDHGGTIGAANRPAGGACFFVRLPIAPPRDA
ncbi:histidine kinase : Histidine kinase,histidine kinase OS=Singulisphaera acidiphila (strain ATCC BAA-1392 / DSM 18658 / VKM B-2454 / MOB10) GN=Sinac_0783 PE=4 SV=1: HAMP: HisKA: HATPase_c [Gemmataceae bacterium]|nr:histidine kinase : Histidine kinase,histidine kinase OS=Singulisphaera acidiphila (strain ATCC BAA-1392 / DSM 18658 / VKM B-2454 / MOB10) GN=Sinac_0783 PE=4 SV=1: HAMP: HisKA: HATPase_c [Gemmataceae bacterium]VTT96480.1 histidine kinase : Histidine kinase,histidine kinase OS=Singulisphaera acidiphila (strain ATCC BAA-1392 / DSM 18658 / VKM B-2454 / MOB10) GN=Sinac_0783 PE=4 SV=1: HAMP: HisKA: HATPase_c [Gemmataceae bacterium]